MKKVIFSLFNFVLHCFLSYKISIFTKVVPLFVMLTVVESKLLKARMRMQRKYLDQFYMLYDDFNITKLPLLPQEVYLYMSELISLLPDSCLSTISVINQWVLIGLWGWSPESIFRQIFITAPTIHWTRNGTWGGAESSNTKRAAGGCWSRTRKTEKGKTKDLMQKDYYGAEGSESICVSIQL